MEKTDLSVIAVVFLLMGVTQAQQNPTNSLPDIPQAVSANIQPPKVVHRELPVYPEEAKAKKLYGTLVVQAVVDKQGNVTSAKMINGPKVFEEAALSAVKAWKFEPAKSQGQPVQQNIQIQIRFAPQ